MIETTSPPGLFDPLEAKILIAELDGFAAALNGCYAEMSPRAKAYALETAHTLAKLRATLVRNQNLSPTKIFHQP